MKTRVINKAGI